jgi:hypothetical protein
MFIAHAAPTTNKPQRGGMTGKLRFPLAEDFHAAPLGLEPSTRPQDRKH